MPRRSKRHRATKLVQIDLWGRPVTEEPLEGSSGVLTLDFETQAVRIVKVRGEPWWVLSDVARVLGYKDATHASRSLRDRHKGPHLVETLGGRQQMAIVSEAGLYRLMMRSERPEAERFQDWVTDEVLPSIRRTGTYNLHSLSRVAKEAKRLRADRETAKIRCDQIDINKASNARLAARALLARRAARRRS
jgi:prophage antirepressor-like protein